MIGLWVVLGYLIIGIIIGGVLKALVDTDCIEIYDETFIVFAAIFWIFVVPIWIVYHLAKFIIEKIKELT